MKTFKEIREGSRLSKSEETLHLDLDSWKSHAKKLGYKISKNDMDGSHHAIKGKEHKGSFFTQSAVTGGFIKE